MKRVRFCSCILASILVLGCNGATIRVADPVSGSGADEPPPVPAVTRNALPVRIWSTLYYSKIIDPVAEDGLPLRDMTGRQIGPRVSPRDWCQGAIEGTVNVEGIVFDYAGTMGARQDYCGTSETLRNATTVRWMRSPHRYGTGNRGNALVPFRTIACDQKSAWIPDPAGKRPARFGERIMVPGARGVRLPDGTVHDGVFTCGDVGGNIRGNHTDIFVGEVRGGVREANAINPFPFVGHDAGRTYEAFILR